MDAPLSERLQQIFGAYVRQETLEVAAAEMADVVRAYPDLHRSFCETLAEGIEAAQAGDAAVCNAVEQSGYSAPSVAEAESILLELLRLYDSKSHKA
jgi:ABC-type nitrate/sulfonate/bicarbonate transport system substrate-binding protein